MNYSLVFLRPDNGDVLVVSPVTMEEAYKISLALVMFYAATLEQRPKKQAGLMAEYTDASGLPVQLKLIANCSGIDDLTKEISQL